jgi:hypothetical protein
MAIHAGSQGKASLSPPKKLTAKATPPMTAAKHAFFPH